jgi:hypothetical protein
LRAFDASAEGTSVQVTAAFDATVADHLIQLTSTVLGLQGGH